MTTNKYEIGKLISQDSILGKVTGTFALKGTGFDYKTMRTDIVASIKQLQYNKYNYQNAKIVANLNAGIIKSKGQIDDENLKVKYDIVANVQSEYPAINGFVRVDTAKLKELNLYKDTLNFSLTTNIKANNLKPRNLDVNTIIDSVKLQLGQAFYKIDSVSLIATSAAGKDSINFYAPFANIQAAGAFDYDKVGDAVVQYVNHYYSLNAAHKISDSVSQKNIPDQQIVFKGIIKEHPLLTAVVPGLNSFKDIDFKGSFASADTDSALNLIMTMPYISYQDKTIGNGKINIASKNELLNYNITFDTLRNAGTVFYGTKLNGAAAKDSVLLNFITQDNKAKDWFGLKASFFAKNNNYTFRLKDSLLLNYEKWRVATDNYISYSPSGLIIHNFVISSDTASISIKSKQDIANSPVDIDIENFNLKSISSIINQDTILFAGVLDAKMALDDLNKKIPAFTGDFSIDKLAIMGQPLGLMIGSASKKSDNTITAFMALNGYGNTINAKGNYYLNNDLNQFDASADIKKLSVASLQGFTKGAIKNASGNIYGNFVVNGKFADPRWKGELNFDTTKLTVTQLGTAFKVDNI